MSKGVKINKVENEKYLLYNIFLNLLFNKPI